MNDEHILPVPAPWKLKGTIYFLSFWTSKRNDELPTVAYSPLEATSSFASAVTSGQHIGGLSQIQIIRYTDSPVGAYDELIICPGYFAYEKQDGKGIIKKLKNARITRIYVSQKNTCWNGRASKLNLIMLGSMLDFISLRAWLQSSNIPKLVPDWNIPKHLARFEWVHTADGKTKVRVYPYDTAALSDDGYSTISESEPSDNVFFQATFQPMRWAPSFPLSFSWLKYMGIDASLVQPPLPDGRQRDSSVGEELPGTRQWCQVLPGLSTRRATLGWIDMSQSSYDVAHCSDGRDIKKGGNNEIKCANFWPGLRRWNMGILMQNADINFEEGLHWDPPSPHVGA
ncbi:hypothetical protein NPX13_g3339 [Xylaria arbuscula]|uniref:Uncharacterized protein n=1 Tax=Xylaria arbuscula TaxID=114810 RepID=A0A9W8NIR0_9PEZI|nr:hypothetical protein NPX13_g3339 [Xylaria arbuscula]